MPVEKVITEDADGPSAPPKPPGPEPKASPRIERKVIRLELKSEDVDFELRTFTGYAAVFNNRDDGGDIIVPGAFVATLPRLNAGKVKLMDGHDYWSGTRAVVGKVLSGVEDERGLYCTFYVSKCHDGDALLAKIADGSLDALSIGYEALDYETVIEGETETRYLRELKLWEVSVVVWGMNALALITPGSVKSLDDLLAVVPGLIEAARKNTEADEGTVRDCIDRLKALLPDAAAPSEGAPDTEDVPEPPEGDGDSKAADEEAVPEGDVEADAKAEAAKEAEIADILSELRAGLALHPIT